MVPLSNRVYIRWYGAYLDAFGLMTFSRGSAAQILIPILAKVLGLNGLIVALIMNSSSGDAEGAGEIGFCIGRCD